MSATLIRKKNAHRLPDPQAVIIYNAVPQSGSATVLGILSRSVSGYMEYYPFVDTPPKLEGMRVIAGHGTQGLHNILLPNTTAWYFTFLRHPLSCAISSYKNNTEFSHKQFNKQLLYANLLRWQGWLARFLGDGDIQRARDTLFNDYAFYGITEHFDESLQRLETLIPEIRDKPHTNFAVSRHKTPDIPSEILEQFYEQNKEDIALYEEALRLFAPTDTVAVRPHTMEYTQNSQKVLHLLESSQDKSEAILEELHDDYQAARVLKEHGHYAAALQALDKTRDAPYFLLRIEIYAHMEYHAHVMEMGTAYVRNMHAQDPLGQVPDIRYCIAFTLVLVIKSFRVLYPSLPFPEEYARWLHHCAGTITILPLLEWCCDKRERDADLTWFLKHCPPSAQHSTAGRGRAWLLLADRHLRREEYAEARANAQESLRCNPHWPETWLTLANAELQLGEPCSCLPTLLRMFRIAESCNLFAPLCDLISRCGRLGKLPPEEWKTASVYLRRHAAKQYHEASNYEQLLPHNLTGEKILILYNSDYGAYPDMLDELFSIPGINRDQCVCATWSETPPSVPTVFEGRFDVHLDSTQPLLTAGLLMQCGLPPRYASIISVNLLPLGYPESLPFLTKLLTGQTYTYIFCGGKTLQTDSPSEQVSVRSADIQPSIAVWGCGGRYRDVIRPQLEHKGSTYNLAYFIDSNAKPYQMFDGLPVYTPEEATKHPVDVILVASAFREAIAERAKAAGLNCLFYL